MSFLCIHLFAASWALHCCVRSGRGCFQRRRARGNGKRHKRIRRNFRAHSKRANVLHPVLRNASATGWQRPRGAGGFLPPFRPYKMRAGCRSCVSVRCVVLSSRHNGGLNYCEPACVREILFWLNRLVKTRSSLMENFLNRFSVKGVLSCRRT